MTAATVIPFPIERARPALTLADMRLRRALSAVACDRDLPLGRRIRACTDLLSRPGLRPDEITIWTDFRAQLRARALGNIRTAIRATPFTPEGAA